MKWFKVFSVMGFVSEWCDRALADGKVTMSEVYELGEGLCKILGIKAEFIMPE